MSDTGQRPDDRAINRRERIEEECEERAREKADTFNTVDSLTTLLGNLMSDEEDDMNVRLGRFFQWPNDATAHSLVFAIQRCAFRIALSAERRKEGLPE